MIDKVLQGFDLFKTLALATAGGVAWYVMMVVSPIERDLLRVMEQVKRIDDGREKCMRRMDRVEADLQLVRDTDKGYQGDLRRLDDWRQEHQLKHARGQRGE